MEYLPLDMMEKVELRKEESLDEDEDVEISAEDSASNLDSQVTDGTSARPDIGNEEANLMTSRSANSINSHKSGQGGILSPRQANQREDNYDVTEAIPSKCTQLFFLTFVNPFGIAWDCGREEFVVWRYAKTRQWPPPFPKSSINIKKQLELDEELERRAEEDAKKKHIRRKKKDPFRWEVELQNYNTILSKVPVILAEEFDEDKDNNNVCLMSEDTKEIYDSVLIRSMQSLEEKSRSKQMEIDGFSSAAANETDQPGTAGSGRENGSKSGTAGSSQNGYSHSSMI